MPDSAALAAGWIEAWRRMDLAWLREHLSKDFVHTSPFGRLEGREHYLSIVEPLARKSALELTVLEVIAEGDRAVVRFRNRTPEGEIETCDWVRVDGEMIREIRSYYDTAPLRTVLSAEEQERLDGADHH